MTGDSNAGDPTPSNDPNARLFERVLRVLTHELRTPLGTIANYTSFLGDSSQQMTAIRRDLLGHIRTNAGRAARMIEIVDEVLLLARRPDAVASVVVDPSGEALLEALADVSARVRAYVGVVVNATNDGLVHVAPEIEQRRQHLHLVLNCAPETLVTEEARKGSPIVDLATCLARVSGPERQLATMTMELAVDLLMSYGAVLEIRGLPDAASQLVVDLPVSNT